MYDCWGVKRDINIRCRKRRWQVMQSYGLRYIDPIGSLHLPLVRHEDEKNYVLCLSTLVKHAGTSRGLMGLEICYLDRQYDQHYLTFDENNFTSEHDFELRYRNVPARRLLMRHNTEVVALSSRTEGLSMPLRHMRIVRTNVFVFSACQCLHCLCIAAVC